LILPILQIHIRLEGVSRDESNDHRGQVGNQGFGKNARRVFCAHYLRLIAEKKSSLKERIHRAKKGSE